MKIAGFSKTSFVDYPGKIACVVFTPFCNMKCWYCQNKQLLGENVDIIDENIIFDYLRKRKDMIPAVVITGGEPTLQTDLPEFIKAVKELGFLVKLDTNGTNPGVITTLLQSGLLDYIAMDVKAPLNKYFETTGTPVDINAISASIDIILNSSIPYEFRTTFAPTLDMNDILNLGEMVAGAKAYYLQQYRLNEKADMPAHVRFYIEETAKKMKSKIGVCEVRGL